jgi:hypothetical protein
VNGAMGSDPRSVRRRLPVLMLPAVATGVPTPVQVAGRFSTMVVLVHEVVCAGCRAYIEQLRVAVPALREWDGRVVVVSRAAGDGPGDDVADSTVTVLHDDGGELASQLAVSVPAVVVADQWGEVHAVVEASPSHGGFPSVPELLEWAQFLAVQCPECEGEAL